MTTNLDRRTALAGIALLPVAGCANLSTDLQTIAADASKIAVTIQTDGPTIVTAVTSAMGIGMKVLAGVGSVSPIGAAISSVLALAQPILARVQTAIAAAAVPVASDLAALQSASNSLIAAASGSYEVAATVAKVL